MKPRPIRMPDALWEELQAEAEDAGLGTAEYVRQILRRRHDTQSNTESDTVADRLNDQEARVAERKGDSANDDTDTGPISTGLGARTREEAAGEPDPEADIEEQAWRIVETVADREGWDDDDRLENRKRAAAMVLQHAVETGEGIGKSSEIVAEAQEEYPVEGQSEETYWRKNVRDVLREAGAYSRGSHTYRVEELPDEL